MSLASLPMYSSPAKLADALGVSTLTVRRWIYAGKLPAHKVGRNVRIRDRDVESFFNQRPFQPKIATAVDAEGQVIAIPAPELRRRNCLALEALADPAPSLKDDPDQVASLAALQQGLQASREGA